MVASPPSKRSGHWKPMRQTPCASSQPWQYSPLARAPAASSAASSSCSSDARCPEEVAGEPRPPHMALPWAGGDVSGGCRSPQEVMARRRQGPSVRATPHCRDTQAAEPGSKSSLLASEPVPARLGLQGTSQGTILEAWRAIQPSLCIPEGTPSCGPGVRLSLERFSVGVPCGWGASLLYLPPELEAAKEEGSVSRVPGSKCKGRPPTSSAAPGSILLMAPATARDAASVRTSPVVPEPARLAAAAAAAGRGASGLPAPASAAAPVPSPSPCRWCVRDSALRWEPPTEVSVPRATGAEECAAAPRPPCTAANHLRLPGCALRSPLKRDWRLPCAHACCEGFPPPQDARGHPQPFTFLHQRCGGGQAALRVN